VFFLACHRADASLLSVTKSFAYYVRQLAFMLNCYVYVYVCFVLINSGVCIPLFAGLCRVCSSGECAGGFFVHGT